MCSSCFPTPSPPHFASGEFANSPAIRGFHHFLLFFAQKMARLGTKLDGVLNLSTIDSTWPEITPKHLPHPLRSLRRCVNSSFFPILFILLIL
jgi:hypothetical protein